MLLKASPYPHGKGLCGHSPAASPSAEPGASPDPPAAPAPPGERCSRPQHRAVAAHTLRDARTPAPEAPGIFHNAPSQAFFKVSAGASCVTSPGVGGGRQEEFTRAPLWKGDLTGACSACKASRGADGALGLTSPLPPSAAAGTLSSGSAASPAVGRHRARSRRSPALQPGAPGPPGPPGAASAPDSAPAKSKR